MIVKLDSKQVFKNKSSIGEKLNLLICADGSTDTRKIKQNNFKKNMCIVSPVTSKFLPLNCMVLVFFFYFYKMAKPNKKLQPTYKGGAYKR